MKNIALMDANDVYPIKTFAFKNAAKNCFNWNTIIPGKSCKCFSVNANITIQDIGETK